jgi:hypothetical protein
MAALLPQPRIVEMLNKRAHDVLLGHNFAHQQIGYGKTLAAEEGEPIKQRTLLEVEVAAQQQRQLKSTAHHKYRAAASEQLHKAIDKAIATELNDIDNIIKNTIGVDENVCAILDILATNSASVSRLEPLVNDLSWLGRELVDLVNLPYYRKQRSKATAVKVENPALALRYIGLDNLQFVVPTMAVRHWMPHSTEPFSLLKRRLRENAMATAIAAQKLAALNNVNASHAFTLGMLLNVGQSVLVRLYLKVFAKIWQQRVDYARSSVNKDLHTALLEIKPDALFLATFLREKSLAVTSKVIERMAFQYLPFNNVMQQLVNNEPVTHPLAAVMLKARCYGQYLLLKEHQLIEPNEIPQLFSYFNFTNEELAVLEASNFTNLAIQIN